MPPADQSGGPVIRYRRLRLRDGRYLRLSIPRTPGPNDGPQAGAEPPSPTREGGQQ